ncbi:MAG: response regulator transcription factor [Oscillospiraceae bacterium]|nr:response regulator transcription factor [Oscillospiraceae bacterium]
MKRLLVVEDEYAIRDLLTLNLTKVGYMVEAVESAERALEIIINDPDRFDVAILDIMLPGISGFELCERIRRKNQVIGIIMLTARTMEPDKVRALAIGADDYVTKPFSLNELIARVDAVYRRTLVGPPRQSEAKELICGNFVLDLSSRLLKKNDQPLDLTQVEFQIMELFFKNQGVALDRETIMGKVWGTSYYGDVKIVDVNIRRLRMKVEDDPSNPVNIVTVWGYGYRWTT